MHCMHPRLRRQGGFRGVDNLMASLSPGSVSRYRQRPRHALMAILTKLANDGRDRNRKSSWRLCAAVYAVSVSGTKGVADLYDNILETDADGPGGLFHRLCGQGGGDDIAELTSISQHVPYGHIDEYEAGRRALVPFDATQRDAVRSILSLPPGQLQW